jgi:hypothetical protein
MRACIAILLLTLLAKAVELLVGPGGGPDPLLGTSHTLTLALGIAVETGVLLALWLDRRPRVRGLLLALTGLTFLAYHGARLALGLFSGCPCLGVFARYFPLAASWLSTVAAFWLLWTGARLLTAARAPANPHSPTATTAAC